jgi:hypothetical protein
VKAPHRETSLRVTPELVALYKRRARRLRSEACRDIWRRCGGRWWDEIFGLTEPGRNGSGLPVIPPQTASPLVAGGAVAQRRLRGMTD